VQTAEDWARAELEHWESALIRSAADAEATLQAPILNATEYPAASHDFTVDSYSHQAPLLIASTLPAEGKTTTAVALSQAFSGTGKKTLLIDADCRIGGIARRLDTLEPSPGLREASRGLRDVHTLIQSVPDANLDVLVCGLGRANSPPDFTAIAATIEVVASGYDAVVIDSTPFLPVPDTFKILKNLNRAAILMVVQAGRTTAFGLQAFKDRVADTGIPIQGVIMTHLSGHNVLPPERCWSAEVIGSEPAPGAHMLVGACFYPPASASGMEQWWVLRQDLSGWKPIAQHQTRALARRAVNMTEG